VRLLSIADAGLLAWHVIRTYRANRHYRSAHPDRPFPPLRLAFDAYGHVDHATYAITGERDAGILAEIIERELPGDAVRICEWGCGPGRVIGPLRRMLRHQVVELCGTDYNAETVEWCRRNLPGITFRRNELAPPLPFADASLDCVYALSVFTHLSQVQHAGWMAELRRVIRPGGLLMLTTHSDAASNRLLPDELRRYRAGELVVRAGVDEGKKWYLAYHPPQFVREIMLAGFELLAQLPARFFRGSQDLWVARRPADT
jgi:SAM-dependent methyltransferase